jgi:hypothetical protein
MQLAQGQHGPTASFDISACSAKKLTDLLGVCPLYVSDKRFQYWLCGDIPGRHCGRKFSLCLPIRRPDELQIQCDTFGRAIHARKGTESKATSQARPLLHPDSGNDMLIFDGLVRPGDDCPFWRCVERSEKSSYPIYLNGSGHNDTF